MNFNDLTEEGPQKASNPTPMSPSRPKAAENIKQKEDQVDTDLGTDDYGDDEKFLADLIKQTSSRNRPKVYTTPEQLKEAFAYLRKNFHEFRTVMIDNTGVIVSIDFPTIKFDDMAKTIYVTREKTEATLFYPTDKGVVDFMEVGTGEEPGVSITYISGITVIFSRSLTPTI